MFRSAVAAVLLALCAPALACGPYGAIEPQVVTAESGEAVAKLDAMRGTVEVPTRKGWKALDTGLWVSRVTVDGDRLVIEGWKGEDGWTTERFTLSGKRVSAS